MCARAFVYLVGYYKSFDFKGNCENVNIFCAPRGSSLETQQQNVVLFFLNVFFYLKIRFLLVNSVEQSRDIVAARRATRTIRLYVAVATIYG